MEAEIRTMRALLVLSLGPKVQFICGCLVEIIEEEKRVLLRKTVVDLDGLSS